MEAGRWYKVDVDLRNESPVSWPLPEMGAPDVRVTYHWLSADGNSTITRAAGRCYMLRPGEAMRLPAGAPPKSLETTYSSGIWSSAGRLVLQARMARTRDPG